MLLVLFEHVFLIAQPITHNKKQPTPSSALRELREAVAFFLCSLAEHAHPQTLADMSELV